MSRLLKGNPLVGLNRMLDLAGPATGDTQLEDDSLIQVIDTNVSIARERSPGPNGGSYSFVFANLHTGNGVVTQTFTPYVEDTAGIRRNIWPLPVDDKVFEVWLKGCSGTALGGAALDGALLKILPPNEYIALATVGAADISVFLALFTRVNVEIGSTTANPMVNESDETYVPMNYRLPRGSDIAFISDATAWTSNFTATLVIDVRILPIGTTANGG